MAAIDFKQLGLLEPWFVITHTIWTTQEDTVFISDRDRNGGRCSVFRSDLSRDSLIVSESQTLETSDLKTEHRPPFLSLSLIKTVSSCVVQIVCVITNQGSSNPNCLNCQQDAYKVYQGFPPTYCHWFVLYHDFMQTGPVVPDQTDDPNLAFCFVILWQNAKTGDGAFTMDHATGSARIWARTSTALVTPALNDMLISLKFKLLTRTRLSAVWQRRKQFCWLAITKNMQANGSGLIRMHLELSPTGIPQGTSISIVLVFRQTTKTFVGPNWDVTAGGSTFVKKVRWFEMVFWQFFFLADVFYGLSVTWTEKKLCTMQSV